MFTQEKVQLMQNAKSSCVFSQGGQCTWKHIVSRSTQSRQHAVACVSVRYKCMHQKTCQSTEQRDNDRKSECMTYCGWSLSNCHSSKQRHTYGTFFINISEQNRVFRNQILYLDSFLIIQIKGVKCNFWFQSPALCVATIKTNPSNLILKLVTARLSNTLPLSCQGSHQVLDLENLLNSCHSSSSWMSLNEIQIRSLCKRRSSFILMKLYLNDEYCCLNRDTTLSSKRRR